MSAKRYKGSFGASVVLQAAIRFHLARARHLRKKRINKALIPAIRGFLARAEYFKMIEVKLKLNAEVYFMSVLQISSS